MRPLLNASMVLGLIASTASAAPPGDHAITTAVKTFAGTPSVKIIRVRFSDPIDNTAEANLAQSNVNLTSRPSGTNLQPGAASATPSSDFGIDIPYTTDPPSADTTIDVSFTAITFADHHTSGVLTAPAVLSRQGLAAAKQAALDEIKKVPKSSEDKNILASGFITTASGGTQGGADIVLNSIDLGIEGLTSFLQIKKSSVQEGDPKNFEAGTRFRHAIVHDSAKFVAIRTALDNYRQTGDEARLQEVRRFEEQIQSRTLAATLLDFAMKLEGQATQFKVSNAVGDFSVKLQTMTNKLGGSDHGFWRLRVVPAGIEGGRNLNTVGNDDTATGTATTPKLPDVDWISRFKAGGEFAMFYDNPKSSLPAKRIELAVGLVERYLFLKETRFDSATNSILTTKDGSRPWCQVDLKFFMGENASARYGFKLAYQRGSLPPVFANTKTFQFGFLYETKSIGVKD